MTLNHRPTTWWPGLVLIAAGALAPYAHGQGAAPATGPVPCADGDLVATDSQMLNRQLGIECNHVESVRAWERAGELFYGYRGTRIDWPAALAEYRRAARLSEGHAPGTLGWRRWGSAATRVAQMLSFGGRGVTRDLAEARRLALATGAHQWAARLEQAMVAEAEAAKPVPRTVLQPGRWQVRLVTDDGSPPEEDTACLAREDLEEIMSAGPSARGACHWLGLSRSPTALDAAWICEELVTGPTGGFTVREEHRVQATMAADRLEIQRSNTKQRLNQGGPSTRREGGTATRIGDC